MSEVLDEVLTVIAAAPHSAAGLTLYALVSTIEQDRAGCLFRLDKLRDLSEEQRRLAYRLMELMVEGGVGQAEWRSAKDKMDLLLRSA